MVETKTILLVEDDRVSLGLLESAVARVPGCRAELASNGLDALECLKKNRVDLLITDLKMPVMDGFTLVSIVDRLYPWIPIVVVSSTGQDEREGLPTGLGGVRQLSKPIRIAQLQEIIQESLKPQPTKGVIQGIGLGNLLQMMEWDQKDVTLEVCFEGHVGRMCMQKGELTHAMLGEKSGVEALREILQWSHPSITFVESVRCKQRTIDMRVSELLLSTLVERDERQVLRIDGPPEPQG